MTPAEIKENIEKINYLILDAAKKSGRNANEIKLCAVSKFHPAEDVIAAVNAGQLLFGENRVQEAFEKFNSIKNPDIDLHIIGSLQTNKVKKAVTIASCIQSVDRLALIEEIEKRCANENKNMEIFLELHTGEESKSGYCSEEELFKSCEQLASGKFPHIITKGLMTMAPFTADEKIIRKSFINCRETKDKINKNFPQLNLTQLSMGMSGDFKIAIEEGSTMVRVGTAIFGERIYK